MSYSEDYDRRCANCSGFHEYGNCPYYEDQSWKNQPRTCWEGYENSNSWNPPHHQCYGEYEHQPFVQEEPHQRQKNQEAIKSLEEMLESRMIQFENNLKYQETMLKALSDGNNAQEAELMQVPARGCVQCGSHQCGERCLETIVEEEARIEAAVQERLAQILQEEARIEALVQERLAQKLQAIAEEEARIEALVQERLAQKLQAIAEEEAAIRENHAAVSLEEYDEELPIEEIYVPQVLEEDEEVEAPKEASEIVIELECEKMVVEREDQMVECAELKEVPIVDFVFGDKLMIDEEKPPSIRIYLMNSWSKGVQGKEQAQRGNIFGSTWNQIRENFLTPLIIYLINLAIISEIACSVMMGLGQNLHDLSGLKQFAIDPG